MNNESAIKQNEQELGEAVPPKGDRVLLSLSQEHEYPYAPDITITPSRITTEGNTFPLKDVTRVFFNKFHPRQDAKAYWAGWLFLVAGIPLLVFGVVGIGAMVLGIVLLKGSGRSVLWKGEIVLEYASGKKAVCYELDLGTNDEAVWQKKWHGLKKKEAAKLVKEQVEEGNRLLGKMQSIADKIGEAIDYRP